MPVCFSLTAKNNLEAGPVALQSVDDEMRKHFNALPSETEWYERWYDTVGFALALGHDWEKIKEIFPTKLAIVEWLSENYTTDAWREHKF